MSAYTIECKQRGGEEHFVAVQSSTGIIVRTRCRNPFTGEPIRLILDADDAYETKFVRFWEGRNK